MPVKQTIKLLVSFLGGGIDIETFDRALADRLFDLRQIPSVSKERELLAAIQLRLHAIGEGRDQFEVYMASQQALRALQPEVVEVKSDFDIPDDLHAAGYEAPSLKPLEESLILSGTAEEPVRA